MGDLTRKPHTPEHSCYGGKPEQERVGAISLPEVVKVQTAGCRSIRTNRSRSFLDVSGMSYG